MEIPERLIDILEKANYVAVLTGAGVSAESGIKTFRDPDGLWAKFNPMELASIDGFMSNPQRVWEWYQYRREVVNKAQPNAGHYALVEFEKLFPQFTLITQNVDRLHQRAGSTNVIELHGNIIDNHCFNCKEPYYGETDLPEGQIPRCPKCGGLIRPSVVWFGEMLPPDAIQQAEEAAMDCDVFFSIGTSAEVYPAASLPYIAKRSGAVLVEVNPNPTSLSSFADFKISTTSAVGLPKIVEMLKKRKGLL
ncbi:MAG: NAD-dependent protein deacetylase of SIR2 family [Candidatus Kapaibacterium sp.]|nr:MAG: NAD-dependent protein deacetylase of SIR2 family [Candidatus Kapabacteria bacterium]